MSELFVGDFEADGLLEEVTKLHCGVFSNMDKSIVYIFCDVHLLEDDVMDSFGDNIVWRGLDELTEWLESGEASAVVGHNFSSYDWPLLQQLGYIDSFDMNPDRINDTPVKLIDSLAMSRHLSPDRALPQGMSSTAYDPNTGKMKRIGAHGLQAWGYKVANEKVVVDDWLGLSKEEQEIIDYYEKEVRT